MKAKLILVEANRELQRILTHVLQKQGFELVCLASLRQLQASLVDFNAEIILIDLDNQDNWADSLTQIAPYQCIILLSSDIQISRNNPAISLMKPVRINELLVKLNRSLLQARAASHRSVFA